MATIDKLALRNELLQCEGDRSKVYDDETSLPIGPGDTLKGNPSIGIGRCLNTKGLSPNEIAFLCENDDDAVAQAEGFPWFEALDPVRAAVVVEMLFELGREGLAGFVNFCAAMAAGDYAAASAEMLASRWAVQVGERARVLAQRMQTGVEG